MNSTNRDIDAARAYHEITTHSYTSVRTGAHELDWSNRPLPYKIYPGAGALALPRDLSLSSVPTLTAVHDAAPVRDDTAIDLEMITRLLFCADGLTRRISVGGQDYHFRAAASAGALYPVEVYLAAAEVDGLEAGLYHFSPADLRLHGIRRGDWRAYLADAAGMRPSICAARAVIVMTAMFWRSAWKYRSRAYRYCFWDGGTILANLFAAANAEGLYAEAAATFEDGKIEALIGIDGEHEGIICLTALGRSAITSERSPELGPLELETIPLSPNELRYDDIVKIHRASRMESPEEVRAIASASVKPGASETRGAAERAESSEAQDGLGLGETILRRGSTRAFAHEPLEADELAAILTASDGPAKIDFPRLCATYVIVNAVKGMEPGAYRYRDGRLELMKAANFRREASYICLEQPLGGDCSALIVFMTDLEAALRALGNRGYRYAHLEAGLRAGRAYLAAYALERGATGLTFYDAETTSFLAPDAAGASPMLMVAVGVPRSRATDHSDD